MLSRELNKEYKTSNNRFNYIEADIEFPANDNCFQFQSQEKIILFKKTRKN